MIQTICQQCNVEFKSYPSDKRKFCSRNCQSKYRIGKPNNRLGTHWTMEQRKMLSEAHKGQIPWCKGKHLTDEHKRNLSLNNGSRQPQARKGNSEWHKNHKRTEQQKIKIGLASKRNWQDPILKEKMLTAIIGQINNPRNTGMKQSQETILKRKQTCAPIFASKEFKEKMQKVHEHRVFPTKNSKPEMAMHKILKENNIDFEKHYQVLGRPDIFIKPNFCIFVDGCFWHACQQCKPNIQYRYDSRKKQMERDARINMTLGEKGYKVIRIWEHEINNDIKSVTNRILNEHQSHMMVIA